MLQRQNGKRIIVLGIAVIILVLGFAVFSATRGTGGAKAAVTIPSTKVVVALQTIPDGTTFRAGEPLGTYFGMRQVPKSTVPFGTYTSVNQIENVVKSNGCKPAKLASCQGEVTTTQTIFENLPVVTGMFSTLGQFRTAPTPSFDIPYGYVAIGVGFSSVNSVVGMVQPGDDIDLIASYLGAESHSAQTDIPTQTQYVLNDIRVISVNGPPAAPGAAQSSSSSSANSAGGSVILLVRYQQALIIQHLKDFGGSWSLSAVLRSNKETDIPHFKTLPVTARWFFVKQNNQFDTTSRY